MPPPELPAGRRRTPRSTPPPPGDRTAALLRTSHLLGEVPAQAIERLATTARVRELTAGDLLWREGDRPTCFHLIAQGLVTIRRHLASGSDVIVAIFGSRESVGDTAAVEGTPYPAEAVVTSDHATVVRLDAPTLLDLSTCCPELAAGLHQSLCRHTGALRTKVEILAAGSVRARLAHLFVHLAGRFGDELADGTTMIPLALSRTALASLVSARTETVIRLLRPWEADGLLVTRDGAFYVSDLRVLSAFAAEG